MIYVCILLVVVAVLLIRVLEDLKLIKNYLEAIISKGSWKK